MDFKLTKTQMLQQELFRKFAETEVKPIAKDMDEKEEYSAELLQNCIKSVRSVFLIPENMAVRVQTF